MCNLHNLDKGQDALRRFFKVDHDESGNQPPLPWIFPDKFAPIVRQADGRRIMEMRRWGACRHRRSTSSPARLTAG